MRLLTAAMFVQYATLLPDMLKDGLRMMIYAGDQVRLLNFVKVDREQVKAILGTLIIVGWLTAASGWAMHAEVCYILHV